MVNLPKFLHEVFGSVMAVHEINVVRRDETQKSINKDEKDNPEMLVSSLVFAFVALFWSSFIDLSILARFRTPI